MVKVEIEKVITIDIKLSLPEARELLDTLLHGPGSAETYIKLRNAIADADRLGGK